MNIFLQCYIHHLIKIWMANLLLMKAIMPLALYVIYGSKRGCLIMLNELYILSKSLERCGLQVKKIHPWISSIKKGDGLRVVLNINGLIKKIEYLSSELVANLWKISSDNHNNFPVI